MLQSFAPKFALNICVNQIFLGRAQRLSELFAGETQFIQAFCLCLRQRSEQVLDDGLIVKGRVTHLKQTVGSKLTSLSSFASTVNEAESDRFRRVAAVGL